MAGITEHGKRVRFYSTVDLVNALEREKAEGRAVRIAASLLRLDLVILDELGEWSIWSVQGPGSPRLVEPRLRLRSTP